MAVRLILVGGFLGAGKTTLLWEVAQHLAGRGRRVGLITNDQAPELVDTAFLSQGDVCVHEVSGSCFCCNFQGLLEAISEAGMEATADVLIAEPVGSCTDLSATIIQPLKDRFRAACEVAPLSVMADPARLTDILAGGTAGLHPSAAYIFRKQLEEADFIVISKTDLLEAGELAALEQRVRAAYAGVDIFRVSAKTGSGLDSWLEAVMTRPDAGCRLAEVDYDIYAEGEAVLGWLNAAVELRGAAVDWNAFAESFLAGLSRRFADRGAAVGHVKLLVDTGEDFLVGNLTGAGETPGMRGAAGPASAVVFTLNARVQMSPEELDALVRAEFAAACGGRIEVSIRAWRCLRPGRPEPTHRYDRVVSAGGF